MFLVKILELNAYGITTEPKQSSEVGNNGWGYFNKPF